MTPYKDGFRDALDLLQKRLQQNQASNLEDVLKEIQFMNSRAEELRRFRLSGIPSYVLHALFGVI
ncbi:MAG: hypothetical protein M1503_08030 [Thaumarchaeota archaeon]|nr:hypothetical protein [Nitrososphaerota archaeon]MCL5318188.1 hypothetical protein [Nitrososphaerota archaeon]